jgi:hypothetical protein
VLREFVYLLSRLLHVLQKTEQWTQELQDAIVKEKIDKQAILKCVFSKPNAKVKWYKGKKEIFVSGKNLSKNI